MFCNKEIFNKELELKMQSFNGTKVYPLIKDLSDCIVFSCIYAGKNEILCENLNLKLENSKDAKNNIISAKKYTLNSYDKTMTLKVIMASNYFSFEKGNDTNTYFYKSELILDKFGNFTRTVELCNQPLNKAQKIFETSLGTLSDGVYSSLTKESLTGLEVLSFKLPNELLGKDNVFYNYKMPPETNFMCRAREKFDKVPFVEMLGMNELSTMLSEQFDDEQEPLRIEDKTFFNSLYNSAKTFYKKRKKPTKNSPK